MKKPELPPEIKGIDGAIDDFLDDYYFIQSGVDPEARLAVSEEQRELLKSMLTELGVRIKINGKWYGLDGTPREG